MKYYEEEIRLMLEKRMKSIKEGIAQRMDAQRRTVTGRSVDSLTVVLQNNTDGWIEGDAQWQSMQKGRAPGKGPYNFREIIKKWIDDRGISIVPKGKQTEEAAKNSLAFLITRNILEKGTSLYRSNGYNDIYDSVVEEELDKMQKQVGAFFELETDKVNENFINDNKDYK